MCVREERRGEKVEGLLFSTHSYIQQTQLGSQVQRGVAIIGEVGVLQALGIVLDDTFEEREVVEVDGSADADGDVNPRISH